MHLIFYVYILIIFILMRLAYALTYHLCIFTWSDMAQIEFSHMHVDRIVSFESIRRSG